LQPEDYILRQRWLEGKATEGVGDTWEEYLSALIATFARSDSDRKRREDASHSQTFAKADRLGI